jgi:hypothetical protein
LSPASLSPFSAVISSTSNASFDINEAHNSEIQFKYADFIIKRILGFNPAVDCPSYFCSPGFSTQITGSSSLCSTGTYQANIFGAITISWSSMYGKFNVVSGQGTPNVSLTKVSNGSDTLLLTLTNSCGVSRVFKKGISVGLPYPESSAYWVNGTQSVPLLLSKTPGTVPNEACYGYLVRTNIVFKNNSSAVIWTNTYLSSNSIIWSQYGDQVQFKFINTNQAAYFQFTTSNSCGTLSNIYRFKSKACTVPDPDRYAFNDSSAMDIDVTDSTTITNSETGEKSGVTLTVSPNPAKNYINISITSPELSLYEYYIKNVNIMTASGSIKRSLSYSDKSKRRKIEVGGMPPGTYIVAVFNNREWINYKLIVQ